MFGHVATTKRHAGIDPVKDCTHRLSECNPRPCIPDEKKTYQEHREPPKHQPPKEGAPVTVDGKTEDCMVLGRNARGHVLKPLRGDKTIGRHREKSRSGEVCGMQEPA